MAEQKRTVYPDTKLVVGLIVVLFALVYFGAAWFPETVKIVFNVKGDGADGQFSGFGTIGDFFGGVINPILTFITIYLLLVSIRIQREELEATRQEMKDATAQASLSADAAQRSLLVARIAERPCLEFAGGDVNKINANKLGSVRLVIVIRNCGRSLAWLEELSVKGKGKKSALGGNFFKEIIKIEQDRRFAWEFDFNLLFDRDMSVIMQDVFDGVKVEERLIIDIKYRDVFFQEWKLSIECEPFGPTKVNMSGLVFNSVQGKRDETSTALDALLSMEASKKD